MKDSKLAAFICLALTTCGSFTQMAQADEKSPTQAQRQSSSKAGEQAGSQGTYHPPMNSPITGSAGANLNSPIPAMGPAPTSGAAGYAETSSAKDFQNSDIQGSSATVDPQRKPTNRAPRLLTKFYRWGKRCR